MRIHRRPNSPSPQRFVSRVSRGGRLLRLLLSESRRCFSLYLQIPAPPLRYDEPCPFYSSRYHASQGNLSAGLFTTEIRKRLYIPLSYIFAFIYSFFALGLNIFKLAWFEIRYSQEIGRIYRNVSIHRGVVEDRSEDVLDPCVSTSDSSYIYIYLRDKSSLWRILSRFEDGPSSLAISCYASFLFLSLLLCEICLSLLDNCWIKS